jgi:hypothetical protein
MMSRISLFARSLADEGNPDNNHARVVNVSTMHGLQPDGIRNSVLNSLIR